jgi:hypothetical protein
MEHLTPPLTNNNHQPLISQSAQKHLAHLFRPSIREPSSRNGLTISGQEPLVDLGRRSIELPSIKSQLLISDLTSPDHPEEWRTLEPDSDWVRVGAVTPYIRRRKQRRLRIGGGRASGCDGKAEFVR